MLKRSDCLYRNGLAYTRHGNLIVPYWEYRKIKGHLDRLSGVIHCLRMMSLQKKEHIYD